MEIVSICPDVRYWSEVLCSAILTHMSDLNKIKFFIIAFRGKVRFKQATLSSLRKHAYSNILKILPTNNENFQIQKFWYFSYFCSKQWGSSNEYPQSIVLSRNKKTNVYPCKPQFYYIKVGFKGVKIIYACFHDVQQLLFIISINHKMCWRCL